MLTVTDTAVRKVIREEVGEISNVFAEIARQTVMNALLTLDPSKRYILVVPSDVPTDDLAAAFEPLRDKIHLVVLQADHVKLLEIG